MHVLRRVCWGTTNDKGVLEIEGDLEPHTDYVVCREEPVGAAAPLKSRQDVAGWIDNNVLGDLRTLRLGITVRMQVERYWTEGICFFPRSLSRFVRFFANAR